MMDDYIFELGQDYRHDKKSLNELLNELDTMEERERALRGYLHEYDDWVMDFIALEKSLLSLGMILSLGSFLYLLLTIIDNLDFPTDYRKLMPFLMTLIGFAAFFTALAIRMISLLW